ncbi:MAG: TRAP transporter large permease [Ruminiclostridium sp.]|jgi:C4-dicarboxylate transporter DctM subunit|nr:TRAP transporter large permease [Ruminiclostridium sp.]
MTAILFLTFLVLLVLGVPIAFAIAVAGVAVLLAGDVNLLIVVQRMFASTDSFPLVAVPFFILAGDLLARGAMSQTLVSFAESLLGRIRGGLSAVAVAAGMFFAAISGSGAATTAAVGATLIPELKKRGYDESSSAALVAASGCIGVVIPPSVPMVLYAVIAGPSVTQLFSNGFLPGVCMGVVLISIALVQAHRRHYPKGEKRSFQDTLRHIGRTFLRAIWAILMPLIILGGIFSGKFTPSESAAVAVLYAALISFVIYRDMTLKELGQILLGSARTSAIIMIIIACSGVFGWVLANWKIPSQIAQAVLSVSDNKYILLLLIAVIVLIAGVFMETSSAVILLTPVFLPLVEALGVSLVHFGILFTIGISIGMITPPVAINLFVASSTTGLPIEKISKSVAPYLLGLIVVFLLYVYLPLFLPGLVV